MRPRKFDERRGHKTWIGKDIASTIERTPEGYKPPGSRERARTKTSSSSLPPRGCEEEEVEPLKLERVRDLPYYDGKRPSVIEDLLPTSEPTTLYGDSGIFKSYLAYHMLLHIACGRKDYFGYAINNPGPCLYLDFELTREEQGTRGRRLAKGMGLKDVPDNLYYIWATGYSPREAFDLALSGVEEHNIVVICIDSVGLALQGDSTLATDAIDFFRERLHKFKRRGVTVLLIDHQASMRAGEDYQDKNEFGSVYKRHLARSRVQVQKDQKHDDGMTVKVRQKKTNFGPEQDPFLVRVVFDGETITLSREEMPEEDLREEKSLNATDRVLLALLDGPAFTHDLQEKTGLKRVDNALTKLRKDEYVEETGVVDTTGGRPAKELALTPAGEAAAQRVLRRSQHSSPPREGLKLLPPPRTP